MKMSIQEYFLSRVQDVDIPSLFDQYWLYVIVIFVSLLGAHFLKNNKSPLPAINPRKLFEFSDKRRLNEFLHHGPDLLLKAKTKFPGEPYKLYCAEGEVIILPPEFLNELRNNPNLDFFQCSHEDSLAHIPGLHALGPPRCIEPIVEQHLTRKIGKITEPLVKEASTAIEEEMPQCLGWTEISPSNYVFHIISRLSTRVFMGETMCRNKEWIAVSSSCTHIAFETTSIIRAWPAFTRSWVHWLLPSSRKLRTRLQEARSIIQPLIDTREANIAEARASGQPLPVYDDSIEWYKKEISPDEKYDPAIFQITLSLVAIHTASQLLQETIFQLAEQPEIFKPLRDEIIQVFSATNHVNTTALQSLRLMDSVLKEVQRVKPPVLCLILRKGQRVSVTNMHMRDTDYYSHPETFDGYRFLREREAAGKDANKSTFAATSERHIGFGYGRYTCPGRFFAANELKIALCHLLLKYEWKLADGAKPNQSFHGMMAKPDSTAKLMIRRRKPEINLDSL